MIIVAEFLIRTLIGIVLLAALVITTVLLGPVHLTIMLLSGSLFEKANMKSQWVW
ncbi:hypothetical protein [Dyadobacter sp. CY356]|uniref:hypothetical protein n=1 Tax=Dyadobacter sp. CY356 TaxID=2906442 RepID=UPI001F3F58BD|nr:hypothetical protein [Dyadobacter sp. CY356]MCF0054412.1 hypothetical protein [Dyadobacter sp. CY356]